jgi:nucleoside-diphosphate-sugar epimerase
MVDSVVYELAEIVCQQVGYTPEYERHLDAPEGVAYRCSDSSKMLSFYTPKISLEEGIKRSILRY